MTTFYHNPMFRSIKIFHTLSNTHIDSQTLINYTQARVCVMLTQNCGQKHLMMQILGYEKRLLQRTLWLTGRVENCMAIFETISVADHRDFYSEGVTIFISRTSNPIEEPISENVLEMFPVLKRNQVSYRNSYKMLPCPIFENI